MGERGGAPGRRRHYFGLSPGGSYAIPRVAQHAMRCTRGPASAEGQAGCGTGPHSPMHLSRPHAAVRAGLGAAGCRAAINLMVQPSMARRGTGPQQGVKPCACLNRPWEAALWRPRRLSAQASDGSARTPCPAATGRTTTARGAQCCREATSPFNGIRELGYRPGHEGSLHCGCRAGSTACASRAWGVGGALRTCRGTAPRVALAPTSPPSGTPQQLHARTARPSLTARVLGGKLAARPVGSAKRSSH